MTQHLVLFSGPLAVGKTSVAKVLIDQHGFASIRTGAYLRELAVSKQISIDRTTLQHLGDSLDSDTDFAWIVDAVAAPQLVERPNQGNWLLDSVRKKRQVEHFRNRFGGSVLHAHFTADENTLRQRYEDRVARGVDFEGGVAYTDAIAHPNEVSSRSLRSIADLVIDLSAVPAEQGALTIIDSLKE